MLKTAVAIPAYNAADTIGQVISQVASFVSCENIFVVDDGSNDQTELLARDKGAQVLRHEFRKGKGSALHDATKNLLEQDYELIITLDSDLQHDPSAIPDFVSAAETFDVVIGKRIFAVEEMPFHRLLSNSITTRLIAWRTGVRVEDSQCGYRLYHSSVLRKVDSNSRHYDYESDILIKAALAGFSIGYVPIKTIYNDSKSSIRAIDILRFMKVFLKSFAIDKKNLFNR
ncbi:MAG: glycosyltransferase family 2 protein [Candidatus Kryptoniota bacterium]